MKKSIKDIDLKNKKVIMRVDFNVPFKDGNIADETRIQAAVPTIKYILEQEGTSLILMSHMGRPKGKVVPELSMTPVSKRLSEILGREVKQLNDVTGSDVESACIALSAGDVVLLENLRYKDAETSKDDESRNSLAKSLAGLADIYVNDAFGTAHRDQASTASIAKFIDTAVSGLLLEKEITYFEKLLHSPDSPLVAILGGSKVSSKIGVITNLLDKADTIIIGGGMSYTFYVAQGRTIGTSLYTEEDLEVAKKILTDAEAKGVELVLPLDDVITNGNVGDMFKDPALAGSADIRIIEGNIPDGWAGVDVGPKTIEKINGILDSAKTVIWNGPMGIFEIDRFAEGTNQVAKKLSTVDAISVIGGGDSVAAVNKFNLADKMDHVSTGGGASLEYLEGKVLPGVAALNDK